MFGMNSGDTSMVLFVGIISVCLCLNYVSSHIRDSRVAKYTGKLPRECQPRVETVSKDEAAEDLNNTEERYDA